MKFVLDTNALWERELREALVIAARSGLMARGTVEVVLPAVAYAERIRQLRRGERDVDRWRAQLQEMGVTVECLCAEQADRITAAPDDDWSQHARDHLIAVHVDADRILVTDDQGPAWGAIARQSSRQTAQAVRALLQAP